MIQCIHKRDIISKYYIIGSNKEFDFKSQTFKYEKFNVDYLRKMNHNYLNEEFYYLITFTHFADIGYDITNYQDFSNDNRKMFFVKFLKEIEGLLNCGYEISLYQFWETTQNSNSDKNLIYQHKEISIHPEDLAEDYFNFEFNTKYIFVQNLTLNS